MTIKDWIYLGITIASYIIAVIAGVYAKDKAKINKATAVGKTLDVVGQLATYAVHETESLDLENEQKRQAAVQIINQGLSWFGIKDVTPNTVNGAIEKAVNAMHLANDESAEPEIAKDVPADQLMKPTIDNTAETQTKTAAGKSKAQDKPEQQIMANNGQPVEPERQADNEVVKNG